MREGHELEIGAVERALEDLGDGGIPRVIRVVDEIPLTTWYRPMSGPLRAEGLPEPTRRASPRRSWYWDPKKGGYRKLSKAAIGRLLSRDRLAARPEQRPQPSAYISEPGVVSSSPVSSSVLRPERIIGQPP